MRMHTFFLVASTALFALSPTASLHAVGGGGGKPPIYDEAANAAEQVDAAITRAKRDNKRVLVQWGANWCGWCHLLHELCASDEALQKELMYEYEVVLVNVGQFDKNVELTKKLGADFKDSGIPYLTVLDADGKPLVQQATGDLEVGDHHDPAKVLAFLKKNEALPQDAEKVFSDALDRATAEQKLVFLHFGAPWCGWCHKLDGWLATKDVAAHVATRAVEVKIDVDRMTNGPSVMKRFRTTNDGIPWFAFVGADGKAIATSDGPNGNLGFPATADEIAQFGAMLTSGGFSADDASALLDSLRAAAKDAKDAKEAKDTKDAKKQKP